MIGILAGMGPKSTGPFIDNVVEQCQKIYGAKVDLDFPQMMIYSCPTPFFIDKPIDHEEMEQSIINGAKRLESTGVDFIAMPCNTAHLYFDKLEEALTVPILNIVEETINAMPQSCKKVALLGTEPTVQSQIYQNAFLECGIVYISRTTWQMSVNEIISTIKLGNVQEAQQLWNELCAELSETVDTVVVACTDLNVVLTNQWDKITFVDSADCLAQALVKKYLSKSNYSSVSLTD
ncbi:aspartate/glutamate racemase family protein [Bacillus solimangrovi]|uniref:Amino-acid racemase n=1 Tax=Bacillus solimangrovi TaxID=1305675 RepID=A0A1E5LIF4_9BACI|nr:amino acid racemase [Bacillus solimangrovi]OEH93857.1 amino-acid racemase [Bacillus solimangrovi]